MGAIKRSLVDDHVVCLDCRRTVHVSRAWLVDCGGWYCLEGNGCVRVLPSRTWEVLSEAAKQPSACSPDDSHNLVSGSERGA